jgi:membrane fusion protein, copper/silver efflux system
VPEAAAGRIRVGQSATATLSAFPGETFAGRVATILPQAEGASRTLTVRIVLPNRGGRLRPGMFANVAFEQTDRTALLVPTEAVIRTGTRTLVMLAGPNGRYRPAEVRTGAEGGGRTEILAGLAEGEKIVASGQFLIDSEASLAGIPARPIGEDPAPRPPGPAQAKPALAETIGRVDTISLGSITITHQAVPAVGWPAMTMTFHLAPQGLAQGLKPGDRVRFAFDQPPRGPTVRRIARISGQ